MGQLDEKYLAEYAKSKSPVASIEAHKAKINSAFNAPTTGITSRDDIINPYDVINPSMYAQTRRGKSAYESDLARLQEIQKQQMASYEEWYNSPEQAAIRERAAGLNPDLIGLDNAGEASSVAPGDAVPGANLPTNGEMLLNGISAVSSIISSLSSVASMASAFSDIPLKKKNLENLGLSGEGLELSNIEKMRSFLAADIPGMLGTSMQSALDSGVEFDADAWFDDDSNFDSLRDLYGHFKSFDPALKIARKQALKHYKDAQSLQADNAETSMRLGSTLSDPRLSTSQLVTISQLRPYTEASIRRSHSLNNLDYEVSEWNRTLRAGMNVESAIDAANKGYSVTIAQGDSSISQAGYQQDYFSEADGAFDAALSRFVASNQSVASEMSAAINQNLLDTYLRDPYSEEGWQAAYLFNSNGGASWEEVYYIRFAEDFKRLMESNTALKEYMARSEQWAPWLKLVEVSGKAAGDLVKSLLSVMKFASK